MGVRDDILAVAEGYIGVPYKGIYQGTGPEDGGFTCSGFSWRCYHDVGLEIPICQGIYSYYTKNYNGWDTQAGWVLTNGHCVYDQDDLLPGDLVFYSPVHDPEMTGHVAIYVGDGNVIHANGGPVSITPLDEGGNFTHGGWPLEETPEQEIETERLAIPMNVIITIADQNTIVWLCNDQIHDLTHPDDITALDSAWKAGHDGKQMPRLQMSGDWYARLVQCCKAGMPCHLKSLNEKFPPRS